MLEFLKRLYQRKKDEIKNVREKINQSNDVTEVRTLGETLDKLKTELDELDAKIKEYEQTTGTEEEDETSDENTEEENRSTSIRTGGVHMTPIGHFGMGNQSRSSVDIYNTQEYRTAFMEFVCRNTEMPATYRATTTTGDTGAVIPTTLMHEIIRELKSYGNILSKVRKLNVQGGVEFSILTLVPQAHWIGEEKSSEDQKLEANEKVSFNYYGLECKIAQTILSAVVSLKEFEDMFIPLAIEAITKALEIAIISGSGNGQCTGITKDVRVKNIVTLKAEDFSSWAGWKKNVFAKMKKKYRNGTFFMAQSTFDGYIDGMVDANGQPIGRVNYGIDGGETYRFGGKEVETVEEDIIAAYETAAVNDVVAVFADLKNYAINSNMKMTTVKWIDHDDNQIKNKVLLICDGKILDPNGVILIKKG